MTEGRIPSATKTLFAVALAVPLGLAIGAAVGASDGDPTDIAVRQVSAGRLADDSSISSSTSSTVAVSERPTGTEVITVAAADAGTAEIVVDSGSLGLVATSMARRSTSSGLVRRPKITCRRSEDRQRVDR